MFADDTILSFDINLLFLKISKKLYKINQRLPNIKKTKYSFCYKRITKDDIPLLLPELKINNYEIKRTKSIKFLGV